MIKKLEPTSLTDRGPTTPNTQIDERSENRLPVFTKDTTPEEMDQMM